MYIVLMGPPGVGKGTQCRRLLEHCPLEHLSTGELLRSREGQQIMGPELAEAVNRGSFAPDEMIIEIVRQRVISLPAGRGVLFDGFPRTVFQAQALEQGLAKLGRQIDMVLSLEAPEAVLQQRILTRAQEQHRADDTAEVIQKRLQVFRDVTAPVLEYYRERGLVRSVDASRSADAIAADVLRQLRAVWPI